MSSYKKNALVSVFGVLMGVVFLWLAVRGIDPAQVSQAAANIELRAIGFAMLTYWMAMSLRIIRWSTLLEELAVVQRIHVAESLIIGYAVNNILPARLGELFRADYAKRRFGLTRSTILGSIVIERLLDLVVILACLLVGLMALDLVSFDQASVRFELIALNAALVIGVIILAIYFLRSGELSELPIPSAVKRLIDDLSVGLGALNRRSIVICIVLSILVWIFEIGALWWILSAIGAPLGILQMLLVMGAASLSTLVPTAPGYIGTYQLVFVITLTTFGYSDLHGLLASTSIQLALFGSVTLAGVSLLIARSLAGLQERG